MLLDEPLSGLDEAGVRQVLDLLSSLREDRDMALLVVEHPGSITPLLQMADRTWRLNDGKLTVKEGPVSSGVARPPIAANTPADHSAEDGGNPGQAEVNCESDSSSVDTAQLVRTSSLPTDVATECVFEIDELEVYRNRRRVIGASDAEGSSSGFSLRIHRGEMVILEAPNGWGKTTLVDAIAGVEPVESGRIRLAGQDITDWPSFRRSRGGLCVVRARDNVFEDLTVREMLLLSRVDDIPPALDGFADKQCSLLSGGERQILALLSALSGSVERTVVILDEPFSGLDDEALSVVFDHINAIRSDVGMLLCLPVVSEHIDSFIEGGRLKCVSV
jgi:branched-chain amino acid transport system ATP-binding protein